MTGHLGDVKWVKHWGAEGGPIAVFQGWGAVGKPLLGMVAALQHASEGHPRRAGGTGTEC